MPGRVFTVPIADLRYDPADHDGPCDLDRIIDNLTVGDPRPIEVSALPDGAWLLRNGRHRWVAAVIMGQRYMVAQKQVW